MISSLIIGLFAPITIIIGLFLLKNVYCAFLLYQGIYCIGVPVVDLFLIQKLPLNEIRKRIGLNLDKKSIILGLFIGVFFFSAIVVFFIFMKNRIINPEAIGRLLQTWMLRPSRLLIFLFIMTFVNSILEELFWRGYLFDRMAGHFSMILAGLISAFFYASYHFVTTCSLFNLRIGILFTLVIFLTGMFWGLLRIKLKSVLAPIMSHFAADLAIMAIYLLTIYNRIDN